MRVAVIGGGIAGLAAAWRLCELLPRADVIVFEASASVGGKLRLGTVAGVTVDVGAEAMLARRTEAVDLARAAGLGDALVAPRTTSAAIRAGGASHPLPARTMFGIPADVETVRASGALSEAAVRRIAAEPDAPGLPPLADDEDVSVGGLVRQRLGNEVADRLVEPLLGGVYAGRADQLSLRATMPALANALAAGGSLVAAAQRVTDTGTRAPTSAPVFLAPAGGVGLLPQALVSAGRFDVRTRTTVRGVQRTPTGFRLVVGAVPVAEAIDVDAVVVAAPPSKAAMLLTDVAPVAATELARIESASMAIVTYAFADVALPAGSGLLVGVNERFAVKAVTLSSQKWPTPTGGRTILRASVGRVGENQVLQRDDDDLVALVRHELRALIGVTAEPVDAIVTRWGGALPQYGVGHVQRVARIRSAVAAVPGLAVCGAAYDGVGIPACIASAYVAADRIAATSAREGQ
jgi:oxygen-dependent protoporphyrinogen oxidase